MLSVSSHKLMRPTDWWKAQQITRRAMEAELRYYFAILNNNRGMILEARQTYYDTTRYYI